MRTKILVLVIAAIEILTGCKNDLVTYGPGDIQVCVQEGKEWLHDFPLFAGIKKKSPPQIAVWVENIDGEYISTLYVTHKIATESWMANGGDRRKAALPVWCHARGIQYPDGLFLPTKEEAVVDGISGATPHGSFEIKLSSLGSLRQFIVKVELNHSTDWNEDFPKNAKEGEPNYSGGKGGSGQPAVIYAADIDLNSDKKQFIARLLGHSSPDGSNGEIYPDVSTLTSALEIVNEITINIR